METNDRVAKLAEETARTICKGTNRLPGNKTESGVAFYQRIKADITNALTTHEREAVLAERKRLFEEITSYTFKACPYEGTMVRAFINNYPNLLPEAKQ